MGDGGDPKGGAVAETACPPRLSIGITGHRRGHDDPETRIRVVAELDRVIEEITRSAATTPVRLVSSIAVGADSWAANAALRCGWSLDVVLPVFRSAYAGDFSDKAESTALFQRHLAAADSVLELPGEDAATDADYERAGHVMLDQCDLLIAVWDGAPARGRGGTQQVLAEAALRHIPVIHIDANGARPTCVLWSGFDKHGLARTRIDDIARAPAESLAGLVEAFVDAITCPDPATPAYTGRLRERLAFSYPLLLAITGVRKLSRADFRSADAQASARQFAALCVSVEGTAPDFARSLRTWLIPRYAAADAAAIHYAKLYRHGFIANFSLAALAVVLALAGLILPGETRPALTAIEVLVVARILWLTHAGRRSGWHRRWIEARYLAERLRCLALSAQLGGLGLNSYASAPHDDSVRIFSDTAHRVGLPNVRADAGYLDCVRISFRDLLRDQIAYHSANARMMRRLDDRLHRLGTLLFGLTAAAGLAVLLFEAGALMSGSHRLEQLSPFVGTLATIVSAAIPALGAAIYGIRMQGDFSGIAGRAQNLAAELQLIEESLGASDGQSARSLIDELRHSIQRAAELMGQELGGWRTAHWSRPLTLPG